VRGLLEEKTAKAEGTNTYADMWPDPRCFKLHPICAALLVVFDEYNFVVTEMHEDGFRHYDDVAQEQIILLVRTGHDDGLSALISFDSLKHEALPLARIDDVGAVDNIRVPLQFGVRFVANLLCREEAAISRPDAREVLGESTAPYETDRPTRDWAEQQFTCARKRGVIEPFPTAADVRKAMMIHRLKDYPPEDSAPFPFKLGWI
jgi:hypothetical protein